MDGFLMLALAALGVVVLLDKRRHVWLKYAWFTVLGILLGWVGAVLYIMFLMPNPFLR